MDGALGRDAPRRAKVTIATGQGSSDKPRTAKTCGVGNFRQKPFEIPNLGGSPNPHRNIHNKGRENFLVHSTRCEIESCKYVN